MIYDQPPPDASLDQGDLIDDCMILKSTGGVTMAPSGDSTRVTFYNEGEFGMNPVRRYYGLLMDKFMGGDFGKNLDGLKRKVEPKGS